MKKTILITGGTGYFGRAMTRYLLEAGVAEKVAIYSRGEAAQARMRDELQSDHLRFLIGDVRDQDRLERAMHRVDLVIHAAALKRVEVGEYNPTEMVKTNVLGTMNAIEAARAAGVTRMVVLSSDKACAPLNAYGASKLMAEKLALAKPTAYVMHPGPMNRGVEIDSAVADGPQAVILPQVTFGIAVRMAVMSIIAGNEA